DPDIVISGSGCDTGTVGTVPETVLGVITYIAILADNFGGQVWMRAIHACIDNGDNNIGISQCDVPSGGSRNCHRAPLVDISVVRAGKHGGVVRIVGLEEGLDFRVELGEVNIRPLP